METLLEKALNHKKQSNSRRLTKNITEDTINVAFEWLKGNISLNDVAYAFGSKSNRNNANYGYTLSRCLREAHARGYIKIIKK